MVIVNNMLQMLTDMNKLLTKCDESLCCLINAGAVMGGE